LRHRQLVRRFDTRLSDRMLPLDDESMTQHLNEDMVRKGIGEQVWEGAFDSFPPAPPASVPPAIWASALAFAYDQERALTTAASAGDAASADGERHVISRRMALSRIPLTRMEYTFAEHQFSVVAVGRSDSERFWAQTFPPRWSRVGRFLKALTRDLQGESMPRRPTVPLTEPGGVSSLEEFRLRREQTRAGSATDIAEGAAAEVADATSTDAAGVKGAATGAAEGATTGAAEGATTGAAEGATTGAAEGATTTTDTPSTDTPTTDQEPQE
jgi:hypothetical protein